MKKKITDTRDLYERTFRIIKKGDLLKGTVVEIREEGVFVDIGYKSEGVIPLDELSHKPFTTPEDVVNVGDEVDVFVLKMDEEGGVILSKKRADLEQNWRRILESYKSGTPIKGTVIERVKGGLIVDVGFRGFVPATHVDMEPPGALEKYIGEPFELKILEVDRAQRKIVLSRRLVLEEEQRRRKEQTLRELFEGEIRDGKVVRITRFGAFIDLGGVDGLVHLSELSWDRVKHPREVVKVGDNVKVMVLKVDRENERISLSIKQAIPDPWLDVEEKFRVGDVIKGKITKIAKSYAFVHLKYGIEGLVPLRELSERKITHPSDILSVNDEVKVVIMNIDPSSRRILLSVKRVREVEEEKKVRDYLNSQVAAKTTLGEVFRDKLSQL
jgi:4-hydroxy-3-methylbut-2-enyl diphosphate reductase